jgi:short subunit dehydrogenase-like uncharacterized protein
MAGRIVLFGATGYTGELAARALARDGARPVLAGRDAARVAGLADGLGGLETAHADALDPPTLRALVGHGDVLVSAAGPFSRLGAAAVEAAIAARATYIDCAAEPAFIREVFERHGPAAERSGCALLPAIGYESVPGNLAAQLALERAGEEAAAVEITYFATGEFRTSGGTRASFAGAAVAPGFAFRDGRIVTERGARRVRSFTLPDGRRRQAVSAGMSEHFALPRLHPTLREVGAYLGWTGPASRSLQVASIAGAAIMRVPGVRGGMSRLAARLTSGSSGGADAAQRARSGSYVVAVARDAAGHALAEVRLAGVDGYEFTGNILAWAALQAASGEVGGSGGLGPVEAFGRQRLEAGCASAGMTRGASPP